MSLHDQDKWTSLAPIIREQEMSDGLLKLIAYSKHIRGYPTKNGDIDYINQDTGEVVLTVRPPHSPPIQIRKEGEKL